MSVFHQRTLTGLQRRTLLISGLDGYPWPKYVTIIVEVIEPEQGIVIKWLRFESDPISGKHAEEFLCYWLEDHLRAHPGSRWKINCWMNYSPCYACAARLVHTFMRNAQPRPIPFYGGGNPGLPGPTFAFSPRCCTAHRPTVSLYPDWSQRPGRLLNLSVKFAFVYRDTEPGMRNRQSFKYMTSAKIEVAAMDMFDYYYLGIPMYSPSMVYNRWKTNELTRRKLDEILTEIDTLKE